MPLSESLIKFRIFLTILSFGYRDLMTSIAIFLLLADRKNILYTSFINFLFSRENPRLFKPILFIPHWNAKSKNN